MRVKTVRSQSFRDVFELTVKQKMTMAPFDKTSRSYTLTLPSHPYQCIDDSSSSVVIACNSSFPQRKTVAVGVNDERSSRHATPFATQHTGFTNENHVTSHCDQLFYEIRDSSLHGTQSITDRCPRRSSSIEIQQNRKNIMDETTRRSRDDRAVSTSNSTTSPGANTSDATMQPFATSTPRRRSTHEQKQRSTPMTTIRVRYDMGLVPAVDRNSRFWDSIQTWPPKNERATVQMQEKTEYEDKLGREASIIANEETPRDDNGPDSNQLDIASGNGPSTSTVENTKTACVSTTLITSDPDIPHPSTVSFFQNSVLWIPESRKDWEDSVSELTATCTSAAYRRYDSSKEEPFHAPLSREYIKDRVKIDDPLCGYQIRHSTGGWLQGFIFWTNFTTWTHCFAWDSLHPLCGIQSTLNAKDDATGSLAKELQGLPRHGDPNDSGIVFDHVAEIGLLGGLGCGELLMRMALEDIRNSPNRYQYIVLQATEGSRAFYERFGFVRVGAVCRYGTITTGSPPDSAHFPNLDTPEQGYRHWTHANESQRSLDLHGGPSYMMCLKLPSMDDTSVPMGNLMDTMKHFRVFEKPLVQPICAPSTPSSVKRNVKPTAMATSRAPSLTDDAHLSRSAYTTRSGRRPKRSKTSLDEATMYESQAQPNDRPTSFRPSIKKRRTISDDNFSFMNSLSACLPSSGPNPLSLTNALVRGSNLRITIYPHKLLPPPPSSDPLIPTVTPRENPNQLNAEKSIIPNETGVSVPTGDGSLADSTTIFPSAANGRNAVIACKKAGRALVTSKKASSIQCHGITGKKVGRPLKDAAAKVAAACPSKMSSKITSKMSSKMSSTYHSKKVNNTSPPPLPSLSLPQKQAFEYMQEHGAGAIFPIDKTLLCKQKVKSYPRDRAHFFNKVVRLAATSEPDPTFYFVLHYDDTPSSPSSSSASSSSQLTLIPMLAKGTMSGKRAGRPRYQCIVLETNANWKTETSDRCEAVSSFMVMKTPFVGQEAWDVLGD